MELLILLYTWLSTRFNNLIIKFHNWAEYNPLMLKIDANILFPLRVKRRRLMRKIRTFMNDNNITPRDLMCWGMCIVMVIYLRVICKYHLEYFIVPNPWLGH